MVIDRLLHAHTQKESSWASEDGCCCGGGCSGRSHTGPIMAMTEDEVCRVLQEKLALRKENENPERPGKRWLGPDSSSVYARKTRMKSGN